MASWYQSSKLSIDTKTLMVYWHTIIFFSPKISDICYLLIHLCYISGISCCCYEMKMHVIAALRPRRRHNLNYLHHYSPKSWNVWWIVWSVVDLDSKKLRHITPLKVDFLDTNYSCDLHLRHPHLARSRVRSWVIFVSHMKRIGRIITEP